VETNRGNVLGKTTISEIGVLSRRERRSLSRGGGQV
jgi:hypothetical protein